MVSKRAKRSGLRDVGKGRANSAESARTQVAANGPQHCLRTPQPPADCPSCCTPVVPVRHTPIRIAGIYCRACCPCCREVVTR